MGPENGGVSITKPLQHLDLETLWGGAWGEPAAQVAAYHSSRATCPPLLGVPGRRGHGTVSFPPPSPRAPPPRVWIFSRLPHPCAAGRTGPQSSEVTSWEVL